MVRKVVVTPTTSYILTPTMETSNRVIRYFRDKKNHFLRVQFVDKVLSKVGSSNDDTSNHCMTEFIVLYVMVSLLFGWGIRGTKDYTIHRRFDLRLGRVPGGLCNTWKMAKNGIASSHQHSRVKSDLIRSSSLQGFEGPTDHDTHGQYNMRRLHKSSGTTLLSNIAEELWTHIRKNYKHY
uniref:RNA-dependent RNA polymerase n=1 Tax=Rhizophagus irregularis (strain DAOM 181602 / DAOM 197198 / MUCL 43194) TaxID=747089 RepID=U9UJW2_RHIID